MWKKQSWGPFSAFFSVYVMWHSFRGNAGYTKKVSDGTIKADTISKSIMGGNMLEKRVKSLSNPLIL